MITKKTKVYLAGGWFDKYQEEALDYLEDVLMNKLKDSFDVYSPRKEIMLKGQEGIELQDYVFSENCKHIKNADLIIASTVSKDMGTIWETGYAYAYNKPIVYTLFDSRLENVKFNLMLAASGLAAFTDHSEFVSFLRNYRLGLVDKSARYQGEVE